MIDGPTGRGGRRSHQGAFTLVELLVVIAIMALLMAILLPVLRSAKAGARRLICQSRLRAIHQGWTLYSHDSAGLLYKGADANVNFGGWIGQLGAAIHYAWGRPMWPRPLNTYVAQGAVENEPDSARVFSCPADRGGVVGYAGSSAYALYGNSYAANIYIMGPDKVPTTNEKTAALHQAINELLPNMRRVQITNNAQEVILAGDHGWHNQLFGLYPSQAYREEAEWHRKRNSHNIAFLDGHVAFTPIKESRFFVSGQYNAIPFKKLNPLAATLHADPCTPN